MGERTIMGQDVGFLQKISDQASGTRYGIWVVLCIAIMGFVVYEALCLFWSFKEAEKLQGFHTDLYKLKRMHDGAEDGKPDISASGVERIIMSKSMEEARKEAAMGEMIAEKKAQVRQVSRIGSNTGAGGARNIIAKPPGDDRELNEAMESVKVFNRTGRFL